jgi:hypothetical protein
MEDDAKKLQRSMKHDGIFAETLDRDFRSADSLVFIGQQASPSASFFGDISSRHLVLVLAARQRVAPRSSRNS